MKCEWCDRNFNERETDGVCPNCGGNNDIVIDYTKRKKENVDTKQFINKNVNNKDNDSYGKKRVASKGRGISFLLLIMVLLSLIMFNGELFETAKTSVAIEVEHVEEKPSLEIPLKFSHMIPTEAIVEGDTAVGIPQGASSAVIVIPEGTKHIEDYAFADLPVMAVVFPESLESIGSYAFYDCYDLEYAKLPNNLKFVGDCAFLEAGDDISIEFGELPSSVEIVGSFAFSNWTIHSLPEGIKVNQASFDYSEYLDGIDEDGFLILGDILVKYNGTSKNITIPDGVSNIDSYAFFNNEAIETVVMPNTVEFIGDAVFYNAKSLKNVIFSENLKIMGNSVFEGCETLESALLPEGMLHIGNDGFVGCEELHELHIPTTLITASRDSFDGCAWYYDNYIGGLDQWVFGDSILASLYTTYEADIIYLPNGIKRVAHHALFLIFKHDEIVFPEGVEVIHDGAISLTSKEGKLILDIPSSVTEIQGHPVTSGISSELEVVIRCNPDSYAFEYAQANGYEIIPK